MGDDRSHPLQAEVHSGQAPFSAARMRSSLHLFAAGKLISGMIGIAWLLTLVRALDVSHYSGYVVLMALLEIVLLVSNAGVYPFAHRYITEGRLPHNLPLLPGLIWRSLAYRIATLALAAGAVAVLARPLAMLVGQPLLTQVLAMYAFVIVFEGSTRYLELAFESLLEQGRAQLCAVLRNGARLVIVALLWSGGDTLNLSQVVRIEASTAVLGFLLAVVVMAQALRVHRRLVFSSALPADSFSLQRLMSFALPLFIAQCLTQLYSPDTIKLIVSRLLGVTEAAAFGFAHALSFVIQRYLPASLLVGLIRPMLVARRAHGGSDQDLMLVGNLILKINLFVLLPVAAVFAVAGREFAALASGGKYADAGPLLFLMTLLLVLTGAHVVLSMLATALEDRRAVLIGTMVSIPGIVVGTWLAPALGAMAMVLGLWLSELLWCSFTLWLLRQRGFAFRIDGAAWAKLVTAASVAAASAAWLTDLLALSGVVRLMAAGAVIAVVYLAACVALAPLSSYERKMLTRLLPARWQR
ncbi:lipopolysaccharide biosynthesis protein [Polaromonas hydrogenivorans]